MRQESELFESLTDEAKTEVINEMRDWAKDCVWAEVESEEIDRMSDDQILNGVERNYCGGVDEFIKCGDYER